MRVSILFISIRRLTPTPATAVPVRLEPFFCGTGGGVSQAQFHAFTDTWSRRRHRHLPSVHPQLTKNRHGGGVGSVPQFPETFAHDGVSRDDGAAAGRTS